MSAAKAAVPRCLTPAQRKAFFLPPSLRMVRRDGKVAYNTPEWKQWLADTHAGKNTPMPGTPQSIDAVQ